MHPEGPESNELAKWLSAASRQMAPEWVSTLEPRKREEVAFHDHDREGHRDEAPDSTPNRRFYLAAAPVQKHLDAWLTRHSKGKTFLDFACGNGLSSVRALRAGAELAVGIDISPVSVANAARNAAEAGFVDRAFFLQRDCEASDLPDAAFDLALCNGVLHHMELATAFAELGRVVRPGGRVLAIEALAHNPVIQTYRRLTPQYRTQFETDHILRRADLAVAKPWFELSSLGFYLLLSPLVTLLPGSGLRRAALPLAHALDRILLSVPGLQWWAWQFVFELRRR